MKEGRLLTWVQEGGSMVAREVVVQRARMVVARNMSVDWALADTIITGDNIAANSLLQEKVLWHKLLHLILIPFIVNTIKL